MLNRMWSATCCPLVLTCTGVMLSFAAGQGIVLAQEATGAQTPAAMQSPPASSLSNVAAPSNSQAGTHSGKAFTEELAAVFTHDRCVHCHEMADPKSDTYRAHVLQARIQPNTDVTGGAVCSFCHSRPEIVTGVWKAPPADLDFRPHLTDPVKLCEQIKASPGFKGDMPKLRKHLLTNELVRWGVENGRVPDRREISAIRNLEIPVPGGRKAWMRMLRDWKKSNYACSVPEPQ